ncbi:MAG: hypothetical protein ACOYNF_10590 [Rhodoferax sp.]
MDFADAPYLPAAALAPGALWLSWAWLLGAAVLWFGRGSAARLRWPAAWLVMLWTLLAGFWQPLYSPAYWLGLAFQGPSVTSALLCLGYLVQQGCWPQPERSTLAARGDTPAERGLNAWHGLDVAGVLLGWLLLLDLLACWPQAIYAWGFSPAALAGLGALTVLLWLVWGDRQSARQVSALLAAVLLWYAASRLPSGNLWDAVLDPLLWLALNLIMLRRWLRGKKPGRSGG